MCFFYSVCTCAFKRTRCTHTYVDICVHVYSFLMPWIAEGIPSPVASSCFSRGGPIAVVTCCMLGHTRILTTPAIYAFRGRDSSCPISCFLMCGFVSSFVWEVQFVWGGLGFVLVGIPFDGDGADDERPREVLPMDTGQRRRARRRRPEFASPSSGLDSTGRCWLEEVLARLWFLPRQLRYVTYSKTPALATVAARMSQDSARSTSEQSGSTGGRR